MTEREEEWRPVVGWEGHYEVSDRGRVRSVDRTVNRTRRYGDDLVHIRGRLLRFGTNRKGYSYVTLSRDAKGKMCRVHRLVASAFIPNPDSKPEVNHINGRKDDNRVENLEWATAKENTAHALQTGLAVRPKGSGHGRAKLNESDVVEIRKRLKAGDDHRVLAEEFDVSLTLISFINTGKLWSHVE